MKTFVIMYENQLIQVMFAGAFVYTLKFPNDKFLQLYRNVDAWCIENNGGVYRSEGDINALGALIELNEPDYTDEEFVSLLAIH